MSRTRPSSLLPPSSLLWLVAGGVGLFVYFALEGRLTRGGAEFVYAPVLEPLPFAAMRGFTFEQIARHVLRFSVLGPSLVAFALGLASVRRRPLFEPRHLEWLAPRICFLATVAAALVMLLVLESRPITDDELTYAYQAQLLLEGKITETTVPPWGPEPFTIYSSQGATGKYPLGEPLVQMPGVLIGVPAILHVVLLGLGLFAWYRAMQMLLGERLGAVATLLVSLSPLLVLTSATGLAHATTFSCLAFVALGLAWLEVRPHLASVVIGLSLGFGLIVRPQSVAPVGAVLGLFALVQLLRRRHLGALVTLISPVLLFGGVALLYNQAVTGSPWTLPWSFAQPRESFGFGKVAELPAVGFVWIHTPLKALENLIVSIVRLNFWWLGWPWALVIACVGAFQAAAWRNVQVRLWAGAGLALVLFNAAYYSPGISETGPVYYLELLFPLSLLGAYGVGRLLLWRRALTTALLVTNLALGTTIFYFEQSTRLRRLTTEIQEPIRGALEVVEPPALVLVESSPTERLTAGWLFSFPLRERRDSADIVSYPIGLPQFIEPLRQRYGDRSCWYFRFHPTTATPEVTKCDEAAHLIHRERPLPGVPLGARRSSTAIEDGWAPR